jgi:Tol biopolymer transport system component
MSHTGAGVVNLTGSAESDDADGVWNKDGTRIAFTSNRALDEEGRRHYDIWVMDMNSPERPMRITSNASHDDLPLWDPSGRAIYFRSNRGGQWNIWRIDLP